MKRTINFNNFKSRTASHSMTGYASAYSEVLPSYAEIKLHCPHSLDEQKAVLSGEVAKLIRKRRTKRLSLSEKNRLNSLNGQIGNLNKTMAIECSDHYEEMKAWVFWRVAQHMLNHNAFRDIDLEAERVLQKTLTEYNNRLQSTGQNDAPGE